MIIHQETNSRSNYNFNLFFYDNVHWQPHFHRNFELIYVMSGSVTLTMNDTAEQLCEGEYALILSNQIHSYQSEGSRCWVSVFSEEFVPKFASMLKSRQGASAKFCCCEAVHRLLQAKLAEEESDIMMKKACYYAACDEYLKSVELTERKANDSRVGGILDYIAENYATALTMQSVAEKFGYEYHYLSRLLSRHYHINFRSLLNEYRIENAKQLLDSSELRISDIAFECGFQSIRSFNHAFKAVTGMTPKEYQNQQ